MHLCFRLLAVVAPDVLELRQILEAELVVRSSVFFSICAVTSSRRYSDCTHGLDKPEVQHTKMFLNTSIWMDSTLSRRHDETHNFGL